MTVLHFSTRSTERHLRGKHSTLIKQTGQTAIYEVKLEQTSQNAACQNNKKIKRSDQTNFEKSC